MLISFHLENLKIQIGEVEIEIKNILRYFLLEELKREVKFP